VFTQSGGGLFLVYRMTYQTLGNELLEDVIAAKNPSLLYTVGVHCRGLIVLNPYQSAGISRPNEVAQKFLRDFVRVQRQGKYIPRPVLLESDLSRFKLECH